MEISKLTKKKLSNMLRDRNKNEFEIKVRSMLIYYDFEEKNGYIECLPDDIWTIAFRAWFYGFSIIGIESNIDDDVPFYEFVIEDFVKDDTNFGEVNPTYWILPALMPVLVEHQRMWLKFYIDIPEMNIPVLAKSTGIEYKAE